MFTLTTALVPGLLVTVALATPAVAQEAHVLDEHTRSLVVNHYVAVEQELRAAVVAELTAEQRAARERAIDALAAYRRRGIFGVNVARPGERQPLFVDGTGRRCAVANLLDAFDEHDLVRAIAAERNDGYVVELAHIPALSAWLQRVGLSLSEAARIQVPTLRPRPPHVEVKPGPPAPRMAPPSDFGSPISTAGSATSPGKATSAASRAGAATGPGTPGADNPQTRGGTTGQPAGSAVTGPAPIDDWWIWWEMNKLQYLVPNRLGDDPAQGGASRRYAFGGSLDAALVARTRELLLPLLLDLTTDPDALLRARAATALGRLAGEKAVAHLLPLLRDADRFVRHTAILALGATGAAEAETVLQALARDGRLPDGDRASSIARPLAVLALGLGRRHGMSASVDDAVAALVRGLDVEDAQDLGSAALLYDMLVPGSTLPDFARTSFGDAAADHGLRSRAAEALRDAGDAAFLPVFQHALGGKDLQVRRSSALALAFMPHPLVVPGLQTAFELEEEPLTRGFILLALGQQGGAAARDFLVKTLRSGPQECQPWSALSLGILARGADDAEARAAIRKALAVEHNRSAAGAYVLASGIARDRDAAPALRERLAGDKDPRQRMFAALSLAMIGDPAARPALLEQLARDDAPLARVGVAQALGCFGEQDDAPLLLDTLKTVRAPELQGLVAVALGFHGTRAALGGLVTVANDATLAPEARGSAVEALGLILDRQPGLMLSELSSSANFADFPDWLSGALLSGTL